MDRRVWNALELDWTYDHTLRVIAMALGKVTLGKWVGSGS